MALDDTKRAIMHAALCKKYMDAETLAWETGVSVEEAGQYRREQKLKIQAAACVDEEYSYRPTLPRKKIEI